MGPACSWQENNTSLCLRGIPRQRFHGLSHFNDEVEHKVHKPLRKISGRWTNINFWKVTRFLVARVAMYFWIGKFIHSKEEKTKEGHLRRSYSINQHMGAIYGFQGRLVTPVKRQDTCNWWNGNPLPQRWRIRWSGSKWCHNLVQRPGRKQCYAGFMYLDVQMIQSSIIGIPPTIS